MWPDDTMKLPPEPPEPSAVDRLAAIDDPEARRRVHEADRIRALHRHARERLLAEVTRQALNRPKR